MSALSNDPTNNQVSDSNQSYYSVPAPVSLPKGGGAIKGMGEKFAANPVTGTGSMTVPIATSPGRSGFGPQLSLSYDSGAGNGVFGFGWSLSLPSVTRKTDKGLPRYFDGEDADVFILSGTEDLVPVLVQNAQGQWEFEKLPPRKVDDQTYTVQRYRPRIEGLFAWIERWTNHANPKDTFWRSLSQDNITTWYGKSKNSRITDPDNPAHIFSWLICESYDDKGNAICYRYKSEDQENSVGIDTTQSHERNRTPASRAANRYLKCIQYGNRTPRHPDEDLSLRTDWLFEVVFDYGDHDQATPVPQDAQQWTVNTLRPDPFSSYRAGFEVRTYRLCQRVLMFHHIPDLPDGTKGYEGLVRSTDFTYSYKQNPGDVRAPIYSFLLSVTQSGYQRQDSGYLKRSLPPVEFKYSQPIVQDRVEEVDPDSLENLPIGLDGSVYQWTDLHGEGIPGILAEQAGAWFYKRNLSPIGQHPVEFAPVELVASKPNLALAGGQAQLMDLAGDGQPDLVVIDGPMPGLYEQDGQEGWQPFRPFTSRLNRAFSDPNLKFVDLDGDGHADVLITEQDALVWHPSLAEEGFGAAQRVARSLDEEKGPRLVFADGTQSVYLADLSGDGLTDLVRIRNGEVCYWPNLGYGRFGAKVAMDNAPYFDHPDQFDQKRIRLADIDGSGTTDIIYLHRDGVRLYFNQSGNRWSAAESLQFFPHIDDLVSIVPTDLLGNGTACLVWSSPLPGDVGQQMRYVSLMGEQKPHLLIQTRNNLGAATVVQYAPSTKFYLQDKRDGKPWITRLPFPVHVVERVETYDYISGNRFVTRYAYHHGYFDGEEREFRGFGIVEQWDTEVYGALKEEASLVGTNEDPSFDVPPVYTKTWFHSGAYFECDRLEQYFRDREYYRLDPQAVFLADTLLPETLTAQEQREACRALKGSMLRQEVYADDLTDKSQHPYTVTEQNFAIEIVQSRGQNHHAVFFVHPRESLAYHYERNPDDPRVAHQMTLEVDEFGNVLQSVAIAYPRRTPSYPEQGKTLITYTENQVKNKPNEVDWYRIGVPIETRTYEITGIEVSELPGFIPFTLDGIRNPIATATEIPYEAFASAGVQKRLIERVRSLYRPNNQANTADPMLLPLGEVESLVLPGESFKLAFTSGLLAQVYGATNGDKISSTDLEELLRQEGRYVEQDGMWWIPSGRQAFDPDAFYLPMQTQDPFGGIYTVTYDDYHLLSTCTADPIGNVVQIANDYRVLQPWQVTDPNGNRSQVAFDALGMVVGTAVMGKETEALGDSLAHFDANLTPDDIAAFFQVSDPRAIAIHHLGTATTRFIYDLAALPVRAAAIARTEHESDLQGQSLQWHQVQVSFVYSDGFGRELQTKVQAEPEDCTHPQLRWVGTGRKVYNNKGKPVKQYEPFFSQTYQYETETALVESGVTPILFYDPLERVVATLHPNHTYEKVVFDAWQQATWDGNDTIEAPKKVDDLAFDPKNDPDVGQFFERLSADDYLPTWYDLRTDATKAIKEWPDTNDQGHPLPDNAKRRTAEKAAAAKAAIHAGTPTIAHLDTLGRPFLTIADNGGDQKYPTHIDLDIEGNQRVITDARNNPVMIYGIPQQDSQGKPVKDAQGKPILIGRAFDLLSHNLYSYSGDAGERWTLTNVAGKPIRTWNSRGFTISMTYDALQRPTQLFVQSASQSGILAECTVYGERHPEAAQRNLKGKVYQVYDAAGVVTNEQYDFKGNLRSSQRQLSRTYKETMDWGAIAALADIGAIAEAAKPFLETVADTQTPEVFWSETKFDALNRPVLLITPDCSEIRPIYNEANLLERLEANLRGAETVTHVVSNIDYNEKGQRVLIEYGDREAEGNVSVARTEYHYDPNTFRLTRLKTTRQTEPRVLQDLQYTYDPVGNITAIRDDAQQTIYFKGEVVSPHTQYEYDALYRLIQAEGREHRGQTGNQQPEHRSDLKPHYDFNDATRTNLAHPHDGQAMRNYTEQYVYDSVGNILAMIHQADGNGWTRDYQYAQDSNRLLKTSLPPLGGLPQWGNYGYNAHGSMTQMPHLQVMEWDFKDQLQVTQQQVVNSGEGEKTYYVYDAAGQRVRKVTVLANGSLKDERIYLGSFEIYRKHSGTHAGLVRESLHIMNDKQRIALVETRNDVDDGTSKQLIRYQLGNHLGSVSLELDEQAQIVSYEEYAPYGSSTYQAVRSQTETPKRYRYTGKERDEQSGLYYHGARYYVGCLARWISCDPVGIKDGVNIYLFVRCNPIQLIDLAGTDARPSSLGNSVDDVIDFEARQAAFEAGKALETGVDPKTKQPVYATKGGAQLPPPTGKQLEKLAANTPEAKELRLKYGGAQGQVAGDRLRENLKERSQAAFDKSKDIAHFGDTSGKLVPEVTFENGIITKVDTPPGGQPAGTRTADIGVTNDPVAPSDWQGSLVDKKAGDVLDETRDLKVSNSYVGDKAGFLEQSGGVSVKESRPWTKLKAKISASLDAVASSDTVTKVLKSKGVKAVMVVAPILASGVAKAAPLAGTAFGAADVASEASQGNSRRAILAGIGMSEMPLVSQTADIGLAVEDAGWAAKEVLDPEQKLEMWYYNTFLK